MEAGKRDQLITLQSLTETNVSGSLRPAWSDDSPPDEEWAMIISERGGEAFQSARTESKELIRICINYRDDVDSSWRILWENVPYEIKAVDRSQRRKGELWLTAEAKGKL